MRHEPYGRRTTDVAVCVPSLNGLNDVSGSKEPVLQFTVPHSVFIPIVYMRYGSSDGFNSDNKTNRNTL
jgi:hypothetical protein